MMRRALQGIMIAGGIARDAVLSGEKTITIRYGWRDYSPGPVLVGCHILNWSYLVDIISVEHRILKEVSVRDLDLDGYSSLQEAIDDLKTWYPGINENSQVTVIKWKKAL